MFCLICCYDLIARENLESIVDRLLANVFGAVLQAVTNSGSYHDLIDRYIHDYTRMVYTPHSELPDEELKVTIFVMLYVPKKTLYVFLHFTA